MAYQFWNHGSPHHSFLQALQQYFCFRTVLLRESYPINKKEEKEEKKDAQRRSNPVRSLPFVLSPKSALFGRWSNVSPGCTARNSRLPYTEQRGHLEPSGRRSLLTTQPCVPSARIWAHAHHNKKKQTASTGQSFSRKPGQRHQPAVLIQKSTSTSPPPPTLQDRDAFSCLFPVSQPSGHTPGQSASEGTVHRI